MAIEVVLPTLHPDQVRAYRHTRQHRFSAVRCGRRWGKTAFAQVLAADAATKGAPVGWFTPDYKIQAEAYNEMAACLDPVLVASSKVEGVMRTMTGGRIDFWSLDNERAGRSRKYALTLVDEAAFTKPNMMDIWDKSIKPTLLDLRGRCVVTSNTNGVDSDNFLWRICNEIKHGFVDFHAPTHNNPYMPADELIELERVTHPLVWRQEYLAEFVDFSGEAFFAVDKWLVDGHPVTYPRICDSVFAVIDTATKAGKDHDGTAVTYYASSQFVGVPLTILDYDIVQIEGAMLETWLPTVFRRLEELAKQCRARSGSLGAWIEDAQAGAVLIQQSARHGWPARAIPTALTAMGKDGRAINVSGYHHRGDVKISEFAYDKVVQFKGQSRNHFLAQVTGFRVGDKAAATRADDLLDTYTYGVALALGNIKGN